MPRHANHHNGEQLVLHSAGFFGIAAAAEAAVAGSSRACFAANVVDFDELARKRNSVSVRACAHAHE